MIKYIYGIYDDDGLCFLKFVTVKKWTEEENNWSKFFTMA